MDWIAPDTCLVLFLTFGEGKKAFTKPICACGGKDLERFGSGKDWILCQADLRRRGYSRASKESLENNVELPAMLGGSEMWIYLDAGITFEVWRKRERKSREKKAKG